MTHPKTDRDPAHHDHDHSKVNLTHEFGRTVVDVCIENLGTDEKPLYGVNVYFDDEELDSYTVGGIDPNTTPELALLLKYAEEHANNEDALYEALEAWATPDAAEGDWG